jgi:hypothetical protein
MKAILRLKTVFAAAAMLLAPGLARAQETAAQPATTNAPAPDTVGPRELQNFSLPGATSKPADQNAAPATATEPAAPPSTAATNTPAPAPVRKPVETRRSTPVATAPQPVVQPPPASVATVAPPPSSTVSPPAAQPLPSTPASTASTAPTPAPAETLTVEHEPSILPWLLAAVVLAGGTLFLLWRRRPREVLADGSEYFVQPEPEPAPLPRTPAPQAAPPLARAAAPQPAPPPPKPAAPASNGIVASRLRPSLEIDMQPVRCLIEDSQVTIEFEVELFNAGTAPARAVLAEASLLNASATQDQELAAFFANPVGTGERMDAIGPMKRVTLKSQVVAPRSAVQEYELEGRKAIVPLIAFNALYEWSGGKAQSSLAYLVGRETRSDKLGPLRADDGPREIRGLGARPLPVGVRT